jgi:hypothetical protein
MLHVSPSIIFRHQNTHFKVQVDMCLKYIYFTICETSHILQLSQQCIIICFLFLMNLFVLLLAPCHIVSKTVRYMHRLYSVVFFWIFRIPRIQCAQNCDHHMKNVAWKHNVLYVQQGNVSTKNGRKIRNISQQMRFLV